MLKMRIFELNTAVKVLSSVDGFVPSVIALHM